MVLAKAYVDSGNKEKAKLVLNDLIAKDLKKEEAINLLSKIN